MKKILLILILELIFSSISFSQTRWTFEFHGGTVYNVPLLLRIKQANYPDIKIKAIYSSEPFTLPIYWDWRFARWHNNRSWEFEAIHHKLYLENTNDLVQRFGISHGFNMLIINRGVQLNTFVLRTGVGAIWAHPENTVRDLALEESKGFFNWGYYLSGAVLNIAVSKPVSMGKRWFVNIETKTTFAYAKTGVVNGKADVYNWAFHLIIGLGNNFIIRD